MENNIYFRQYSDLYVLNADNYEVTNLDNWSCHQRINTSMYLIKEDGVLVYSIGEDKVNLFVKANSIIGFIDDIPFVLNDSKLTASIKSTLAEREKEDLRHTSDRCEKCSEACVCDKSN